MAKQKLIAGVDFSGSTKDVPWITTAILEGESLRLKSCEPIRREKLTKRLLDLCNDADNADAVVAMDFPFGVPDDFAKAGFGFPDKEMPDLSATQMPERWKVISQLGNLPAYIKSIGTRLKKHGDLERFRTLPRKWDKKHFGKKAFAPLAKSSPIDMYPMTFYGMKMLHTLWETKKCKVPPLDNTNRTGPVLLETMPGAALGTQGLETTGYKTNTGINTLDNLKTRKKIIKGLSLRDTNGIAVRNIRDYYDLCIFNDDALDSIVAAVVAAMWATDEDKEHKTIFHLPEKCQHDGSMLEVVRREGGIYVPNPTQETTQRAAYPMLATDRTPTTFADARAVHADALRLLELGDIRDAAEKAWCATKRATDALILARTGEAPELSPDTSRGLLMLAAQDEAINPLIGCYYSRQGHLHGDCFYMGNCEPLEEIHRRIRQTADYIDDAERLASYSNGT